MLGYLKAHYYTCRRSACPCHADRAQRHGPYWYLVWRENGKRCSRYVPLARVPLVREFLRSASEVRRAIQLSKEEME